ncbi:MAG: hypothetical protein ABI674_06750 [Spartobacteria bacterium]
MKSFGANLLSFPGTILAWASFHLVRLGERILPRPFFALALWPALGVLAFWNFAKSHKVKNAWHRFPRRWRPSRASYFLQQTVGMAHARVVYTWPDRFPARHWRSRCELAGDCDLAALRQSERPVVFATLHFGPFETLPYWLRAFGLPVTALVGRPAPRQRLKNQQYSLSAPADIPVVVPVTDAARLRRTMERARFLLVYMDVNRGKQIAVPFGDHMLRLATGAIRLAMMRGALLVPCLIVASHPWRYTIHFQPWLTCPESSEGSAELRSIAGRLCDGFLPLLARFPAQCSPRLLSSILHLGEEVS